MGTRSLENYPTVRLARMLIIMQVNLLRTRSVLYLLCQTFLQLLVKMPNGPMFSATNSDKQ